MRRTEDGATVRRRAVLAATLVLGHTCLAAGGAVAEEAGTVELQPITVEGDGDAAGPDATIVGRATLTGTKTDTPVVDVPAAVSIVTEQELKARQVENMQQALAYTAGVSTDEFGNDDRYDYFRIRGFDATSLGTYRDGLPMRIPAWFTWARLEPYGLQRVEVLKGSTSTLFGLNAPGGLVNAITKRPQATPHGEVTVELGENAQKALKFDVGGAADKDGVWSYRLTGLMQDAETSFAETRDDRRYIAPALTYRPDEDTSLTLLADYSRRDGTGARGVPHGLAGVDPHEDFFGEPDFNKFETEQVNLGYLFEHRFSDAVTVRQNARFTHVDLDYKEVYGASLDPTANRSAFAVDGSASRFAIDNQLQWDHAFDRVDNKLLVGLDATHDETREDIFFGTAGPIDVTDPVYCGRACIDLNPYVFWDVNQTAVGLYAQDQLTLDDRWILTLGGRYDRVMTDADYRLLGTTDSSDDAAFTKRAGLTYKVIDGLALYANYSESFQPLVAPTANGYQDGTSVKPQEGTQYEVGVKYRPEAFNALFTLALFDLTQTNVPSWDPTFTVQRQIGEINVKGVELEAKVALTDQLNLTAAYSFWDASIAGDGNAAVIGNTPDRTPRHLASLWLDYTLPISEDFGKVKVGGGVRYVGSTYGNVENTVKVDDYLLVDMALSYSPNEKTTIAVNATNLLDAEYVASSYYGTDYYGDGRKVVASLTYHW